MLYVFYGNDVIGARGKARDFLSAREGEEKEVIEITPDAFTPGMFRELAGGVSLFSGTQAILIDTFSEAAEAFHELVEEAELLTASSNTFVIIESTLDAEAKKIFRKYADEMVEAKRDTEKKLSPFSLADALRARDRKSLWILLTEAARVGLEEEKIIGALLWQVKMLRLAERTKSAEEARQDPFPYGKAKRALSKFKKGELDRLSRELVAIYHEGHEGKRDITLALEQWVLVL